MTIPNNPNIQSKMSKEDTSSLSMLLEAAENRGRPAESRKGNSGVQVPNSQHNTNATGNNSSAASGGGPRVDVDLTSTPALANSSESLNLSLLASAVQNPNGASVATLPPPTQSDAANVEDPKKARAALIKTAKSFSSDPLVQLSMLRAMEQQQVMPDAIRNTQKKVKESVGRHAKASKQQHKARPETPFGRQQASSRSNTGPNAHSNMAPSNSVLPLIQQQASQPGGLESLLASLSQQNAPIVPAQTWPPQGGVSDPKRINGALALLQSLMGMVPQQGQQPLNMSQANGPPQDGNAKLMGMIQNLASSSPAQQSATAQTMLPLLTGALNMKGKASKPQSQAAHGSSLGSSLKGSDNSNSRDQSSQIVRIPCRARGMPSDHNFQTAHFVLPKNIKHGQDLVCSYPACRDGGVKFRYCLFCRIPVAKRNFRLRHSHVDIASKPPIPDEMKVPSTIFTGSRGSKKQTPEDHAPPLFHSEGVTPVETKKKRTGVEHRHESENKRRRRMETEQTPALEGTDVNKQKKSHKKKKKDKRKNKKRKSRSTGTTSTDGARAPERGQAANVVDDSSQKKARARIDLQKIGKKRLYMWSSLLGQRPSKDDEDNMSKWLMDVLAVSDFRAPLKDDKDNSSSSPSSLSLEDFDSSDQNPSGAMATLANGSETASE